MMDTHPKATPLKSVEAPVRAAPVEEVVEPVEPVEPVEAAESTVASGTDEVLEVLRAARWYVSQSNGVSKDHLLDRIDRLLAQGGEN
jgi:hypothetical protein